MANQAYEQFLAAAGDDDDLAPMAAGECLAFARMAAAQGSMRDAEILVFVLAKFGEWQISRGRADIGQRLDAMALRVADGMADGGHEGMAQIVANAGVLSPETLKEAKLPTSAAHGLPAILCRASHASGFTIDAR
jgi:hypothetical protein